MNTAFFGATSGATLTPKSKDTFQFDFYVGLPLSILQIKQFLF